MAMPPCGGRTCYAWRGKGSCGEGRVHRVEVAEVRDVDVPLHHVLEGGAGLFQDRLDVLQDLGRLLLDAAHLPDLRRALQRVGARLVRHLATPPAFVPWAVVAEYGRPMREDITISFLMGSLLLARQEGGSAVTGTRGG